MTDEQAKTKLEGMVAVSAEPFLPDGVLDALVVDAKRADRAGRAPSHVDWQPTFDLNWAAAEAWGIKAGLSADKVNWMADGRQISASDIHRACMAMAQFYKRKIVQHVTVKTSAQTAAEAQ